MYANVHSFFVCLNVHHSTLESNLIIDSRIFWKSYGYKNLMDMSEDKKLTLLISTKFLKYIKFVFYIKMVINS